MDVIATMILTALRDDDEATNGIRALLGHSTTPYGVYHTELLENPDFNSSKRYISFYQITSTPDMDYPGNSRNFTTLPVQETYMITAWGGDTTTTNNLILKRIRYLLQGCHKVTKPTTDADVYDIKMEWEGPELYDKIFGVHYRQVRYRVWLNDVSITG